MPTTPCKLVSEDLIEIWGDRLTDSFGNYNSSYLSLLTCRSGHRCNDCRVQTESFIDDCLEIWQFCTHLSQSQNVSNENSLGAFS